MWFTVIIGRLTPQIKMYRHNTLPEFGIGNEQADYYWNSLIRQMLLEGLIQKDIEEYGILKFTARRREIPEEAQIIQDCIEQYV